MPMELYSLHATAEPGEFIIQKFDTDYHCESVYALSASTCLCPQGHKPKCRHRTMLSMFLAHGHIGDGWFLEWNTRMWRKPVNDIVGVPLSKLDAAFAPDIIDTDYEVSLADETVMGTSAATAGDPAEPSSPAPEAVAPPPSPPEGPILARAAEAAPASPVVAGAPIVKRRKIP